VSQSGKSRVLVADVGATNTRVAIVADDGTVVRKIMGSTPREGGDPLVIARTIASMIRTMASDDEIRALAGIGISAASPVDQASGSMVRPPNLPFAVVPLAGPLCEEFGVPVNVVNDARAAVLAEARYGAGRGCEDVVYITISTGIGGGAFIGGRLIEGCDGNAGEIGHFTVETRYDLCCGCGGVGH
jgi:glucokinase